MLRLGLLVSLGLFLHALPCPARTWYVTPDGSGDAPTIRAAIDSISYRGDIIELADGIYTEAGNRDLYNLEKMFLIRSQSDNPQACIVDIQGTPQDLHWGIIFDGSG